ncbi:MAG: ribbon-helix-helix domain-containing protein [Candidatus Pacearchaeota archaeon]|nr:ribbon-helix-helix domain-containing protein [Candidatus Pacearchaeota archaeon]
MIILRNIRYILDYLIIWSNTRLNMKGRISATVDEETIKMIDDMLKKGIYRNKSHIIEEAIKLLKKQK